MAEVYDTNRFGELYYASRQPTSNHLFLAANHLAQICRNANIPYAFLGGWTVRLRGGSRETQDVDIAVATTMELFRKTLLQMPRICFPQTYGQTAVNLFVQTGMSYDQGYKDTPNLAVQVDVIISGHLNSPTDINNNTSEVITLPNGFNARVVNTLYLLRGKFHAFITRGKTNTNDYQDLVFLISQYQMEMPQYNSHIDKAYRLAFLDKYAEMNSGNKAFIEWMRQKLGLAEGQSAPVQQQSSQPEASGADWVWDETYRRYRRLVKGEWQWAPL
ncbi:uncharacterized protein EKO05_0005106 [Ascochyta rabiei]|uniref:Uncharacterized protein n=1 Tax=Didymella rabiei TaxID=5454 RepID=A0A162WZF4_DIDRA|nr:uncharacterized protein EKO05_0005106 [Ascochyta rabiei]KZM19279.1 hypothetical protein ST47_g9574 [Ascochyta rabiei]UPX14629.1 hypothetical protein EKO05_0005106 [Ascochyta rabiei]